MKLRSVVITVDNAGVTNCRSLGHNRVSHIEADAWQFCQHLIELYVCIVYGHLSNSHSAFSGLTFLVN